MTLDTAMIALGELLAHRLLATGYITELDGLEIDAADALEPAGDETAYVVWAALTRGETRTVRTILGRPAPRYVVEHRATLQLSWAGPDRASGRQRQADALAGVASLPVEYPTLEGAVERFFVEEGQDEPLAPNGWSTTIVCAFRIRSSDPLGLTP